MVLLKVDDRPDDPMSDTSLLQAVRDGSSAAFGILYARHRSLAIGLATQALPAADVTLAEDVAESAFTRVLTALRNGNGPTDGLRSYLATTVRREAWRLQRRQRRQAEMVEQWAVGDAGAAELLADAPTGCEPGDQLGSHVLLGEAFGDLSERWRRVLWLTAVEGRKPAEVALVLGLSAGSASALAYRARLGLIAAYVAAYQRTTDDEACVAIADQLAAHVAAGAPDEGFGEVTAHLAGCAACRDVSRGVDLCVSG
ncbi:MAG: polymerase sigma factor, sigma-70 family [Ilumatobacteraceae bacterium]|nr:polymerase sigma factor, sigma-70 family [Ilumatobacteraceae bacterium]